MSYVCKKKKMFECLLALVVNSAHIKYIKRNWLNFDNSDDEPFRCTFTMDPKCCKAVTEAFVRLHEDGTIYRR